MIRAPRDSGRALTEFADDVRRELARAPSPRVAVLVLTLTTPAASVEAAFPLTIGVPFPVGAIGTGGVRNLTTPSSLVVTGCDARWDRVSDSIVLLKYITGLDVGTRYELRLVLTEDIER